MLHLPRGSQYPIIWYLGLGCKNYGAGSWYMTIRYLDLGISTSELFVFSGLVLHALPEELIRDSRL